MLVETALTAYISIGRPESIFHLPPPLVWRGRTSQLSTPVPFRETDTIASSEVAQSRGLRSRTLRRRIICVDTGNKTADLRMYMRTYTVHVRGGRGRELTNPL